MVSAASEPRARLVALPGGEPVEAAVAELAPVGPRPVIRGSHVRSPTTPPCAPPTASSSRPGSGSPRGRPRAPARRWSPPGATGDGCALAIDPDGRPCFEVGAGARVEAVRGEPRSNRDLGPSRGRARPGTGTLSLTHRAAARTCSRWSRRRGALRARRPARGPGDLLLGAEQPRRRARRRPPRRQARLAGDPLGPGGEPRSPSGRWARAAGAG